MPNTPHTHIAQATAQADMHLTLQVHYKFLELVLLKTRPKCHLRGNGVSWAAPRVHFQAIRVLLVDTIGLELVALERYCEAWSVLTITIDKLDAVVLLVLARCRVNQPRLDPLGLQAELLLLFTSNHYFIRLCFQCECQNQFLSTRGVCVLH